jgi:hypothetical protein
MSNPLGGRETRGSPRVGIQAELGLQTALEGNHDSTKIALCAPRRAGAPLCCAPRHRNLFLGIGMTGWGQHGHCLAAPRPIDVKGLHGIYVLRRRWSSVRVSDHPPGIRPCRRIEALYLRAVVNTVSQSVLCDTQYFRRGRDAQRNVARLVESSSSRCRIRRASSGGKPDWSNAAVWVQTW